MICLFVKNGYLLLLGIIDLFEANSEATQITLTASIGLRDLGK